MSRSSSPEKSRTNRFSKEEKENFQEAMEKARGKYKKVKQVPDSFKGYKEQEQLYKWLVKVLEADSKDSYIGEVDIPLLEQVVQSLIILRQCLDEINKRGVLVEGADKYGNPIPKENPAIKIRQNELTKYTTLCNQLGLSPSARASLQAKKMMDKEKEQDELLQILNE